MYGLSISVQAICTAMDVPYVYRSCIYVAGSFYIYSGMSDFLKKRLHVYSIQSTVHGDPLASINSNQFHL